MPPEFSAWISSGLIVCVDNWDINGSPTCLTRDGRSVDRLMLAISVGASVRS